MLVPMAPEPLQPPKVGFTTSAALSSGKENLRGVWRRMIFVFAALAQKKQIKIGSTALAAH